MNESFTNYFNYFTEIEEHFQRARGTALFLLSPLDWALIETWKNAEVPLEAVLRGIDAAFDKWRTKRIRSQQVNSLAFCAQAVMVEAQRMADTGRTQPSVEQEAPFPDDQILRYLQKNAADLRATALPQFHSIADVLDKVVAALPALTGDLEALEQQLTGCEQKLIAIARTLQTDEQALAAGQQLEAYLRPYRSKMTAPQIAMLQTQFMERAALDAFSLPRLSLFYLR